MAAVFGRLCTWSVLLLLLLCVGWFPLIAAFYFDIAPGTPYALQGTVQHRTAIFNPKGYDVSGDVTSMDAIRELMLREHTVDLYRYGVDEHLCTSTFQTPSDCTSCPPGVLVKQWFQQYAGGKILLALRGPASSCQSAPNPPVTCSTCSFQFKSFNAGQLNASALVLGHNTTNEQDTPCELGQDTSIGDRPTVPTVIIFHSKYSLLNQALQTLAGKVDPIPASGEVTDKLSNEYLSPSSCQAGTSLLFLVVQIGMIPIGLVMTLYSLKTKLLPQAEEGSRQQQNQRQSNPNQQAGPNEQPQNAEATAVAAAAAGAADAARTQSDSHAVTIPSTSSSSVEEKSSNSFAPAPSSLPGSAVAISDGLELDEFRSTSSTRSNPRTLSSSSIDEQALLSSDALASDLPHVGSVASNSANRERMDVEDFNRRSLIDSHRRLYAILDTILGFASAKALFYGSLLYNITLLVVLQILIVNARDEACMTDLKWTLLCRAGVCFAAIFHAFGQSFSNVPSIMRLFFYTRAAGVFFSLMFFTRCLTYMFLKQSSAALFGADEDVDCSTRAPLSSSAVVALFMLFLAGGVELLVMRVVGQAYTAYTKGRATVAPAYEGLLVLFGRALRKHALSGCVMYGPLDQPEPVTTLQLSLLPTTTYHAGMYAQDDAVCAICLGEYEAGERLRVLPCHHFHSACLDQWITSQKPTCPTCRRSIPLTYQQYEEERSQGNHHNDNIANDSNVRRGERRRDGRMAVPVEDI